RLPAFMKAGNLTPFLDRKLSVLPHGNTCLWCCTSFVNWGGSNVPRKKRPVRTRNLGCRNKSGVTESENRIRTRPGQARVPAYAIGKPSIGLSR
ncbi:MAG: hypothetical protein JWM65_222, partial [Sphingomonas bacterium]|nr:hypothetical protein [Sphingomonas bacterium]